ncbi:MAG: NAD(P)-binding domain-containing protein [Gemmatimonadaceae bacterium]
MSPLDAPPAPPAPRAVRTERYDTIVIGAGQAGLAVGYHLARRDADFLILESAARVGESWRRRWDSLRTFTSAATMGLPGMPFPAAPAHLPYKDEIADYLERYAQRFDLPVRCDTKVTSLTRSAGRYLIETGEIRYEASHVVVATGPFTTPSIPALAQELAPGIRQLHSSDYRNPFALDDGAVLVVGAGNAGARIALEVARFRPVVLAGATPRRLRRTLMGRDIHRWLLPVVRRLTNDTRAGRLLRRHLAHDPLVGITDADFARAGVVRRGRVTGVSNGRPVLDGEALDVHTVIWSTGFVPDYRWIRIPLSFQDGAPRMHRGVVAESPGLYFVGLRFLHSLASAFLGGVGDDAAYLARRICEDA